MNNISNDFNELLKAASGLSWGVIKMMLYNKY